MYLEDGAIIVFLSASMYKLDQEIGLPYPSKSGDGDFSDPFMTFCKEHFYKSSKVGFTASEPKILFKGHNPMDFARNF